MNNYLRKYRERKYFMRIILSINLLIISVMLASLLSAFLYSKKISLDSQQEANEKVLSQINYNITYMNETVKNFAISMFYDTDMAHLLFSGEEDAFEDTDRINKLTKTIAYNSFIHSIVFYNSKRNQFFSSGDDAITSSTSNLMNRIDEFLSGGSRIFKMQLMPLRYVPDLKHPERTQQVFSLYMYDSLDAFSKKESALIINVKPEWLFEKLELMNRQSSNRSNRIFVLDQNKEAYSPDIQDDQDLGGLKDEVYRQIAASHRQVSQFTYMAGGEKQIVNYIVNSSVNWVVVDVEPYVGVLSAVDQLKVIFATVAAICLVLAVVASLVVSNRLYSPINGLLKQTKRLPGGEPDRTNEQDEISYISHIYNHLIEKLMTERTKHESNEAIVRSYYLRKLVTDSGAFTSEEWAECVRGGYVNADLEKASIVGVLKFDRYEELKEKRHGVDVNLLNFAASNILREYISEELRGDVVDIRGEHLVLFFEAGAGPEESYAAITRLLRQAQQVIGDYYHVTFTVALSDIAPHYRKLTASYEKALDYYLYKMNFGLGSVITPEMVQGNLVNAESHIPLELERRFAEAIKASHPESVIQELEQLRRLIAGMSSDAVVQSVIQLGILIKQTVREINQNKLSPLLIDLRSIDRLVFEKETLDEIFAEFGTILGAIFEDQKRGTETKDHFIIDTIKDVIQANYANPNLSLQEIADMLRMSAAYVGRIFKKQETISVSDYINEIRLLKSVMLLENNNQPVNEISEKVGFSSPSYFFKLFKKRFGTTPKDYRIKKSLSL
ncbi:helix-turn-helix domain-containing protein [Paenibacillus sacheonensis]|uniref:Helix-turn-helix domain-containing protein n=1 Tax=Paenibacillus sacheonensis TaxID=742054 RepID=A0A7X4YM72_9BACL|nr:helix-turn-helix domain-containing protein [Paenibacillus sacheonensis]MBM7565805.1 AraC-like DNA-binding protein [Paenibacillus sacheonensis]NBC68875.1 helix-turn-helix domain-containing protein [Paenibacillus sacheonensis]